MPDVVSLQSDNNKHALLIQIALERLVQGLRFNYDFAYVQKKRVETVSRDSSIINPSRVQLRYN